MRDKQKSIFYSLLFPFCGLFLGYAAFPQSYKPLFVLTGEYIIENNKKFDQTIIGGLSGIEYCSGNIFYLISDDPGKHGSQRFYKVSIDYTKSEGIKTVNFIAVKYLKPSVGKSFVSSSDQVDTSKFIFSDAESIRYDKNSGHFIWSSEGFNSKSLLFQPFIFNMDTNGLFINKINIDPVYLFDPSGEKGAQHNSTFEAIAFIPGSGNIVYCSEKSLFQDISLLSDSLKPIRITVADKRSGNTLSQFAYKPDDVFKNNSNGVVEILALSMDTFFVLERAYDKQKGNSVRLYRASVNNAVTDIKPFSALKDKKYTFLKKEFLLDFSKSGAKHIDNIEGMTWGYPLSGNKKSILFVSDNNFNSTQITQLILFEYEN